MATNDALHNREPYTDPLEFFLTVGEEIHDYFKDLPIGALPVGVSRSPTLVLAIIPFDQVRIYFSSSSEAGELACPDGTLQRTLKHLRESNAVQPLREPSRISLAAFRKRQVGQSRMLACNGPGGFPVPGQRKLTQYRFCFRVAFT